MDASFQCGLAGIAAMTKTFGTDRGHLLTGTFANEAQFNELCGDLIVDGDDDFAIALDDGLAIGTFDRSSGIRAHGTAATRWTAQVVLNGK